ncbi:(2Fe-2S)-binding protein [Telluria beijingensis]|uniref:(2Fe-2S)-binding protein n=1 Tax=Telluria beijingensis TaxID=3068633 RepID=UPI0027953496|nr:(2Fe-2S)-binding protein [Massilia sp. REN29]
MLKTLRIQPNGGDGLRPAPVTIFVNGAPTTAYPGETVATALLAAGSARFRTTARGAPRAPVCNMGVCFECAVTVDGRPGTRSCMTLVADGMRIERS